jgi:hypothetical protein
MTSEVFSGTLDGTLLPDNSKLNLSRPFAIVVSCAPPCDDTCVMTFDLWPKCLAVFWVGAINPFSKCTVQPCAGSSHDLLAGVDDAIDKQVLALLMPFPLYFPEVRAPLVRSTLLPFSRITLCMRFR